MPVYVYRREDGSTFEVEQRITAEGLAACPTTGQKVERVLQPFTPRYRGTGFYSTDHRRSESEKTPKPREGPELEGAPRAAQAPARYTRARRPRGGRDA